MDGQKRGFYVTVTVNSEDFQGFDEKIHLSNLDEAEA